MTYLIQIHLKTPLHYQIYIIQICFQKILNIFTIQPFLNDVVFLVHIFLKNHLKKKRLISFKIMKQSPTFRVFGVYNNYKSEHQYT